MASSEDPDKPFKTLGHLYNYIYIIVCYRSGGWGLRLRRIGQDLDLGMVVSHQNGFVILVEVGSEELVMVFFGLLVFNYSITT